MERFPKSYGFIWHVRLLKSPEKVFGVWRERVSERERSVNLGEKGATAMDLLSRQRNPSGFVSLRDVSQMLASLPCGGPQCTGGVWSEW